MRHIQKALLELQKNNPSKDYSSYIQLENISEAKGVAPSIKFIIQSDPILEVGINGIQASDILEYIQYLFKSLDEAHPCVENTETINKIREAISWQKQRTKDRTDRNVEGTNNP